MFSSNFLISMHFPPKYTWFGILIFSHGMRSGSLTGVAARITCATARSSPGTSSMRGRSGSGTGGPWWTCITTGPDGGYVCACVRVYLSVYLSEVAIVWCLINRQKGLFAYFQNFLEHTLCGVLNTENNGKFKKNKTFKHLCQSALGRELRT